MITMETKLAELEKYAKWHCQLDMILRRYHPTLAEKMPPDAAISDLGSRTAYNTMISLNLILRQLDAGGRVLWPLPSDDAETGPCLLAFAGTLGGPCALVVPRGNDQSMSPFDSAGIPIAVELDKLGVNAFVLCHRVGRSGAMQAPLEDLAAAIRLLFDRAEELGCVPGGYAVFGFSSGGHLAGLFGADAGRWGVPAPGALVLASAPLSGCSGREPLLLHMTPAPEFVQTRRTIAPMLDEWGFQDGIRNLSVPKQVREGYPPTYIIHGERDSQAHIQNAVLMAEALKDYGIPYVLRRVPDAEHNFGKGYNTSADGWLKEAAAFWLLHKQNGQFTAR